MSDFKAKMHQIRFRLGSAPDPLARFKGPTSKGRKGRGKKGGKGGEGRDEEKERGRRGKGKGGEGKWEREGKAHYPRTRCGS